MPELAEVHGVPTSPAYPFYGKIYCVVTPGNDWYDDLGEFDCTPASFDLKNGEILIITLIKEND